MSMSLRPGVVLAYHGIADVAPELDPIRLFVAPDQLRWQLQRMRKRGYELISIAEFAERLMRTGKAPGGACALTFDDGTEDQATTLPRILDEVGARGTVYVCPGLLGEVYPWAGEEAGVRFMTRGQFEEMAGERSIEIGAHTNMHTELHEADRDSALQVMTECKELLEEWVHRPVPSFCYPRCHFSPGAREAARAAGFTSAVTCGPRGSWDPFELRRESMHTPDGPVTFALKSRGLYYPLRDRGPAQLARWATRPYRHRRERMGD